MVVHGWIVTCGSRVEPRPICTWGPITQNGPILTPASSSTVGSMTAVGWMSTLTCLASAPATTSPLHRDQTVAAGLRLRVDRNQAVRQVTLDHHLTFHAGHAPDPAE